MCDEMTFFFSCDIQLPLILKQEAHIVDAGKGTAMIITQYETPSFQCLSIQRLRFTQFPLSMEKGGQVVEGGESSGMSIAQNAP